MEPLLPSPITFLPVDLYRWDNSPAGDALVVPVWVDIRPLRGASGLLDWRLCGRISQMIRDGRVLGTLDEKLLLVTSRIPWRKVLAVGVGESRAFCEAAFRDSISCFLNALHGLGAGSIAIALPGRDIDLIRPERALRDFADVLEQNQEQAGPWLSHLTIIDTPAAAKAIAEASRSLAPRPTAAK